MTGTGTELVFEVYRRHCEERSDEAIHRTARKNGLLRCARNDVVGVGVMAEQKREARLSRFSRP
jgi:hypothetical protein